MGIDAENFLSGMEPHAIRFFTENIISVREEVSSGHATRCHLCDNVGLSIDAKNISLRGKIHQVNCKDCGSDFIVIVYVLEATAEHTARRTRTHVMASHHSDCKIQLCHELTADTLEGTIEYVTPKVTELSERTEEHHVSYEPEITVPLCSSCHGQVHQDGQYEPLQPDMKRSEWSRKNAR